MAGAHVRLSNYLSNLRSNFVNYINIHIADRAANCSAYIELNCF